jgi:hypothetical protein
LMASDVGFLAVEHDASSVLCLPNLAALLVFGKGTRGLARINNQWFAIRRPSKT